MTLGQINPTQGRVSSKRKSFVSSFPHKVACPECGCTDVRRVRRNWAQRIISKVSSAFPYVCTSCIARFYSFVEHPSSGSRNRNRSTAC